MVGNSIKLIRKAKGLSQKELAQQCQIHITTMSAIEKGNRYPTEDQRMTIATILDVPFEVLSFLSLDSEKIKDPLKDEFAKMKESFTNLVISTL